MSEVFKRQTNGQDLAGFVLAETDGRTDVWKAKLERGEERRKGEKFVGCKHCN